MCDAAMESPSDPVRLPKLEIPPAPVVASAGGTEKVALHLLNSQPLPTGGLGRAIERLAQSQEQSGESIKNLGTMYENKYQWSLIANAEQRRAMSSILSYTSFAWDANAIIEDLKVSIETFSKQASNKEPSPANEAAILLSNKTDGPMATNRAKPAPIGPITILQRNSSSYPQNTNLNLQATKLLETALSQKSRHNAIFAHTEADATGTTRRSSGAPGVCNAPGAFGDSFISPHDDTTASRRSSLFSTGTHSTSTPACTPLDYAGRIRAVTSGLKKTSTAGTRTPTGNSTHLGDGITHLKLLSSINIAPAVAQVTRDHADSNPGLTLHSPPAIAPTRLPAKTPSDKIYMLQPSSVAMAVAHVQHSKKITTSAKQASNPPKPAKKRADPFPYPRSQYQPDKGVIYYDVPFRGNHYDLLPLYTTSQADKHKLLVRKLAPLILEDETYIRSEDGTIARVSKEPLHIFIDLSNIVIGFYDFMKMMRGVPITQRMKAPEFSFDNFHALLARDRLVEKRIVVGSLGWDAKRPNYMMEAEELGYEMNIMQRVAKAVTPRYRKNTYSNGGTTSDATSGAETSGDDRYMPMTKLGEQGVDELLHFKILESVVDAGTAPGTIVLATGDGAEAEFSGGFKAQMERALNGGWRVELYSWSHNLSSVWKASSFTEKWGDKFRYIPLDGFAEELHGWWLQPQA